MKITFLLLSFVVYLSSLNAQTKNTLPFIGTKEFNFTGGSCCNQTITITKEGQCIIRSYEAPEIGNNVYINYKGKYAPIIWVYKKGKKDYGYKIEKRFITELLPSGRPRRDCGMNSVCKTELY
jgi:hypothetical protein